jgi:hypothetical protein
MTINNESSKEIENENANPTTTSNSNSNNIISKKKKKKKKFILIHIGPSKTGTTSIVSTVQYCILNSMQIAMHCVAHTEEVNIK